MYNGIVRKIILIWLEVERLGQRKVDQEKIKKILEKRGYKDGEAPRGYEIHHIVPVEDGGKETAKNIRVIKRKKHETIHTNRMKRGKI